MGDYYPLLEPTEVMSRAAEIAKTLRSRTPEKLHSCAAIIARLPQDFEDMAAALGEFVQEEHTVVGQPHFTRPRHAAPADQPYVRDGVVGARNGRVVTNAARSPVRLATRWMRVVSMAPARVMAGRMVVSRRASIDFPALGGPGRRTLGAEPLLELQF
jgi:hypothetical protein